MENDLLDILTLYTNFIGMAFSLWFAIYILARSQLNNLTFRAVAALLSLALYYYLTFAWIANISTDTEAVRSFAIIIALVAAHDLTFYLLPEKFHKKLYWLARSIILVSGLMIVLLFWVPPVSDCDPRYTCPTQVLSLWSLVDLFKLGVFFSILYNLWVIRKSGGWVQNAAFYTGVLLATSTIGYGFLGVVLSINLPRFISTILVLCALALLSYSVARHQAMLTRRTTYYDFPVTLATIGIILAIYILIALQMDLNTVPILLLSVLVIFTHSTYDFVREILDRLLFSQEREVRRDLRSLGQDTFTDKDMSIQRYLSRALAILCHNLDASSGFIAVRNPELTESKYAYLVATSYHSLPVGTPMPPDEIVLEVPTQPHGYLAEDVEWLAPAYGGGEQVALVGLGPCKGQRMYSEEDLYWLEDIADEIGAMIYAHNANNQQRSLRVYSDGDAKAIAHLQDAEAEQLLSALAFKPDPEMVKYVEEGFRNIHDYTKLGRSPLVAIFHIGGDDHIDCGKQVQRRLLDILDKLRPLGQSPPEPLPREWYSYTILHDAYVQEKPAREIMGKLYISEGTYYRTRRRALRGITRAMLEIGAVS